MAIPGPQCRPVCQLSPLEAHAGLSHLDCSSSEMSGNTNRAGWAHSLARERTHILGGTVSSCPHAQGCDLGVQCTHDCPSVAMWFQCCPRSSSELDAAQGAQRGREASPRQTRTAALVPSLCRCHLHPSSAQSHRSVGSPGHDIELFMARDLFGTEEGEIGGGNAKHWGMCFEKLF